MSAEKRPASGEPEGQLVVKRPNLGERALARANASGSSALVQSVCVTPIADNREGKNSRKLTGTGSTDEWAAGARDGVDWALGGDLLGQVRPCR